jgi:glycosyltransferase involved in cell wall biosynthesis
MAVAAVTLSVVVVSRNQRESLERLVTQLLNQDCDSENCEIIIVDDESSDGTREWLMSCRDARIKPQINKICVGRAAARNQGIRAASGGLIVMIDGDHTIQSDFLRLHAAWHKTQTCAVIGKSLYEELPDNFALYHYLNGGGASKLPPESPLPGRYFQSGNCSIPKSVLINLGMFDERFTAWGGEDLDLGARIEDAGIPIFADRAMTAIHHHRRSLNDLLLNLYEYGARGIPIILSKHPRMFCELNLDRILPNPYEPNRFSPFTRAWFRLLMSAPVYQLILLKAKILRRIRLPRILFDYLHLRQYGRGFMESQTKLHQLS